MYPYGSQSGYNYSYYYNGLASTTWSEEVQAHSSTKKQVQTQSLLSERKLKQHQDQAFSNNTMATLFCTLETIALKLKGESLQARKFNGHDFTDFGKIKDPEELYTQADIQLTLFLSSAQLYTDAYENYAFPRDWPLEKVESFLISLQAHPSLQPYITNLVHIFNKEYSKVKLSPSLNKKEDEGKAFPLNQLGSLMSIRIGTDAVSDNTKRQYEANPEDYEVSIEESAKVFKESSQPLKQERKFLFHLALRTLILLRSY